MARPRLPRTSPSQWTLVPRCATFTRPHSEREAATTERRVFGPSTIRITTVPSSSTSTATTSRRSATPRSEIRGSASFRSGLLRACRDDDTSCHLSWLSRVQRAGGTQDLFLVPEERRLLDAARADAPTGRRDQPAGVMQEIHGARRHQASTLSTDPFHL